MGDTAIVINIGTEDAQPIQKLTVFKNWTESDGAVRMQPLTIADESFTINDSISAPVTYATYQIKADGYAQADVAASTVGQTKVNLAVVLHKTNQSRSVTTIAKAGDDPVAGVKVDLWGDQQTSGTDGKVFWTNVTDGDRSLRWDPSGIGGNYQAGSKTVTVSASATSFEMQLVQTGDKDAAAVQNPATTPADQEVKQQLGSLGSMQLPAVDPEALNLSKTAYQGYYTSAQVKMYIGDLFIDEMVSVEWGVQENSVPLFGYCSRLADAYAEGRSLIQGQILINYTAPWYLGITLQNHKDKAPDVGKQDDDPEIEPLAALILQGKPIDNAGDFTPDQWAKVYARVDQLKSAGVSFSISGADSSPAVYKRVKFNIVLEFGDPARKNRRMLRDCKLISCNQVVDQSGNNVFESYGFIARDAI